MRILMLCDFFDEQLEYQENLLLKYYRKHGFDVSVVCSNTESAFDYYAGRLKRNQPASLISFNGARIYKLGYRAVLLRSRIRILNSISKILENEDPDLIFAHDISPNFPEVRRHMQLHPKCKLIMDYHADYSNSGRGWLSRMVLHKLIRRKFFLDAVRSKISRVFPVVPAGFDFLREMYGIPDSSMELLPLGGDYDLARETECSITKQDFMGEYGFDDRDFVIFTGGKLNNLKKTHLLIEAIRNLSDARIKLLVVGKPETPEYDEILKNVSKGMNNIKFLGWLNTKRIYETMAISDLAVFPASQSILWQQAMCMHLPLIVGDSGGQSFEYLNANESVISLPKDKINVAAIATVVKQLFEDRSKLDRMSDGASKTASEMLNWNKLIYRTLEPLVG
jgi:1,2-diacylglycerol 3-alpha-glucosyltransferase